MKAYIAPIPLAVAGCAIAVLSVTYATSAIVQGAAEIIAYGTAIKFK